MIRFAYLGSGSSGNAMVVESGQTRLLLDCGFGPREAVRRLARLGLTMADIDGILVTHEHSDHIGGVFSVAARYGLAVWLSHGSLAATPAPKHPLARLEVIDSHQVFSCGDLEIWPFPVPHDAREPVQYVFSDGSLKFGVLTDAGHVTAHMLSMLTDCDGLVLEANHDKDMLARGKYPAFLKRRVGGAFGHLENGQAAELLARIGQGRLQHLVAAHLSQQNNRPELVRQVFAEALGCSADWIGLADQAQGLAWREIR